MATHEKDKHNSKIPPESRTSDTSIGETLQGLQDCYIELNLDEDTSVDVLKISFNELIQKALADEITEVEPVFWTAPLGVIFHDIRPPLVA